MLNRLSIDRIFDTQVSTVGMAQEYQTHGWQEIFVAGVVRIRTQDIGRGPKTFFYRFNMFELRHSPYIVLSRFLALGCGTVKTFEYVLNNVFQTLDFVVRQVGKCLFTLPL